MDELIEHFPFCDEETDCLGYVKVSDATEEQGAKWMLFIRKPPEVGKEPLSVICDGCGNEFPIEKTESLGFSSYCEDCAKKWADGTLNVVGEGSRIFVLQPDDIGTGGWQFQQDITLGVPEVWCKLREFCQLYCGVQIGYVSIKMQGELWTVALYARDEALGNALQGEGGNLPPKLKGFNEELFKSLSLPVPLSDGEKILAWMDGEYFLRNPNLAAFSGDLSYWRKQLGVLFPNVMAAMNDLADESPRCMKRGVELWTIEAPVVKNRKARDVLYGRFAMDFPMQVSNDLAASIARFMQEQSASLYKLGDALATEWVEAAQQTDSMAFESLHAADEIELEAKANLGGLRIDAIMKSITPETRAMLERLAEKSGKSMAATIIEALNLGGEGNA